MKNEQKKSSNKIIVLRPLSVEKIVYTQRTWMEHRIQLFYDNFVMLCLVGRIRKLSGPQMVPGPWFGHKMVKGLGTTQHFFDARPISKLVPERSLFGGPKKFLLETDQLNHNKETLLPRRH